MTPKQEHALANHLRNEARKLRKLNAALTQTSALDYVAIQHGYANWRHFTNSLPDQATPQFTVTLQTSWRDPETKQYFNESIEVTISKPLKELFPKTSDVRSLIGDCSVYYDENIIAPWTGYTRSDKSPQSYIRSRLNWAARLISFVSATDLLPANAWSRPMSGFIKTLGNKNPAAFDHTNIWRNSAGKYVITTEPYFPRLENEFETLQSQSELAGYHVALADWLGIHNPDLHHPSSGTRLVLISHKSKGPDLSALTQQLNRLPNEFLPGSWSGKTTEI